MLEDRARFVPVFASLLVCSFWATTIRGQQDSVHPDSAGNVAAESEWTSAHGETLGLWLGLSFDSKPGLFLSDVPEREFLIMGLRYGRVLSRSGAVAISYSLDLIPLAVVSDNPAEVDTVLVAGGVLLEQYSTTSGGFTYGAGIVPVGLQISVECSSRISVGVKGSAGVLQFLQPVPTHNANKLNFSFDFGGAISVRTTRKWAANLGFKLHHLSSAGMGEYNPGLDAYIFYFGWNHVR